MTKEELKAKHPNSSPEEIDALHAQIHETTQAGIGVVRDGVRIMNDGSTSPHVENTSGENPHPDTSKANAALRKARAAKKPAKKKR